MPAFLNREIAAEKKPNTAAWATGLDLARASVEEADARHRAADMLERRRVADPRRMVVYQVSLELLHLCIGQHHFGKLTDAGVDPIHDLMSADLIFEHRPAHTDAFQSVRIESDLFPPPRNADKIFDR